MPSSSRAGIRVEFFTFTLTGSFTPSPSHCPSFTISQRSILIIYAPSIRSFSWLRSANPHSLTRSISTFQRNYQPVRLQSHIQICVPQPLVPSHCPFSPRSLLSWARILVKKTITPRTSASQTSPPPQVAGSAMVLLQHHTQSSTSLALLPMFRAPVSTHQLPVLAYQSPRRSPSTQRSPSLPAHPPAHPQFPRVISCCQHPPCNP